MKTIKSEFIGTDATGKDFFRVIIVSESAPDSFPTSGADVDGVPDTAGIAAGSVLLTPDGNSVLYADDWSEGGGGTYGVHIMNLTAGTLDFFLSATVDGDTLETYLVEGGSELEITVPAGYWLSPDFNTDDTTVVVVGEHEEYDDGDFMFYQINGNVEMTCGSIG